MNHTPSIAPSRLIKKKRDGEELSREEIFAFIQGISDGSIADYQATAFLMAVYFQGMSLPETVALTEAMMMSGERIDLSSIPGAKCDKHSTGGVGDKVSIILAPLAAACGLKVPMMAGRGLGHTGGTIDKLESIRGYSTQLSQSAFASAIQKAGCSIIAQSDKIAPADKKLYALRDVTGTIDCIPLITASILSKKLAEGTQALVQDIKLGNGAFMKSREQAKKLAKTMIQVGSKLGLKTRIVLTDMSQPLGYAAGNSLEIIECIEILRGSKGLLHAEVCSTDLRELTLQLCAHMLQVSGLSRSLAEAKKLALQKLSDGSAWNHFLALVRAHGGDVSQIENPLKLPISKNRLEIRAPKKGILVGMNTESIGWLLVEMGAGRHKVTDRIDPSVGLIFHKKLGSSIKTGDLLATAFLPESTKLDKTGFAQRVTEDFLSALEISSTRKPVPKLMIDVISQASGKSGS